MLKVMDFTGDYSSLEQTLHTRKEDISVEVNNAVTAIINEIRAGGDEALMAMCARLDGFKAETPDNFLVSEEEVNIGISVRKGNTALLDAMNAVLSGQTADDFNARMAEATAIQPIG